MFTGNSIDASEREPAARIGRYEVIRELGRGSMGRVYLAHDPNIGRRIALKVLSPSAEDAEDVEVFRKRFVLEARAAGRLSHPGIVTVYDAGIDPSTGMAFLAMEYVEGSTLAQILRARGRLGVEATAEIGSAAATALAYAHRQGVVHRDIKPANLVVGPEGEVKILDFGVAKLVSESHTVAGEVLGTPAYMAPEQVRGETPDGRSDLFSLGAALYQCLAGGAPFRGDSLVAIAHQIVHADPPPLAELESSVPGELGEVIARALAKDSGSRFATGQELAEALAPFRAAGTGGPSALASLLPVAPPPPPESPAATDPPSVASDALLPLSPDSVTHPSSPPPFPGEVLPVRPSGTRRVARRWARDRRRLLLASSSLLLFIVIVGVLLVRGLGPPESPIEALRGGQASEGPLEGEDVADPDPAIAAEGSPAAAMEPSAEQEGAGDETLLVVLHENRLRNAQMTIWIDGESAWSQRISADGNFLQRARGQLVRADIPLSAGEHTVEVRITGVKGRTDVAEIVRAVFPEGRARHLRVLLRPGIDRMTLEWESAPSPSDQTSP